MRPEGHLVASADTAFVILPPKDEINHNNSHNQGKPRCKVYMSESAGPGPGGWTISETILLYPYLSCFFFFFLGPQLQHMEVPRPGGELEL